MWLLETTYGQKQFSFSWHSMPGHFGWRKLAALALLSAADGPTDGDACMG